MATEAVFLPLDPDSHESALSFLMEAEAKVLGRLQGSSNATLAVELTLDQQRGLAVYKPAAGERPLHDFEQGSLPRREVATYRLSEVLGWHLVPPTVLRDDLEYGPGSVQLFIPHDPERNAFTLFKQMPEAFHRIVVLDILANNADRKAGHVILDERNGRLWAIDNGLTFHSEEKLRTVLWPFAGRPVPTDELAALQRLDTEALRTATDGLIDDLELAALAQRTQQLLEAATYPPEPEDRYPYPWPPI